MMIKYIGYILLVPFVLFMLITDGISYVWDWIIVKYMYYVRGLERHKYYDLSHSNSFLGDLFAYLSGPSKVTWEPVKKKKIK